MPPVRKLFVLLAVLLTGGTATAQDIPTDSAIRAIIKPRVDTGRYAGVAVGLIARDGRQVVTGYGPRAGVTPFDGHTVFEIGSITKTFTAAILADMVAKGEVALDDPVARLLPPGMKFPERDGKQITLLDLATQTSGLPRLPNNLEITNPQNPYATYTPAQLATFLAAYELPRAIGAQYEYSNLGFGLLGMALSYKGRRDYEVLVRERVLRPLGMNDTKVALTPSMLSRLAPGHDESGRPAGLWDIPTLAGSGALRSTVNDMLKYVRANADTTSKPLGRTLATTHGERRPTGTANMAIGLGWHRLTRPSGRTIVWHNGGTGGYRTFTGYDESTGLGVVVLANSAVSVDDIGFHLLDASFPLAPIPRRRMAIPLAPAILDRYIGDYELAPAFSIAITREGNLLYAQATGQPKFPLLAETDSTFFLTAVDAQLTFTRDGGGAITGLILHQGGQNIPGKKKQAR